MRSPPIRQAASGRFREPDGAGGNRAAPHACRSARIPAAGRRGGAAGRGRRGDAGHAGLRRFRYVAPRKPDHKTEATQGMPGCAGSAAGIRRGAQRAMGAPQQGLASAGTRGRAAATAAAMRHELHALPEPDSDMLGAYIRDAIGRGGCRAALEYYGGDEDGRSEAPSPAQGQGLADRKAWTMRQGKNMAR